MDTQQPTQRIILITGASKGIGAATAKALAAPDVHLVCLGRNVDQLEQLDDAITAKGGSATLVPLDLRSDHDKLDALGQSLYARYGQLDGLLLNAAMLGALTPVTHATPKMWDDVMQVNLHANWRLLRSMYPLLLQSSAARVVAVTSGVTQFCPPAQPAPAYWGAYAASKCGLEALLYTFAAEVKDSTIRANLFDPGIVATAMRKSAFPGEDASKHPTPEHIAPQLARLLQPEWTEHSQRISAH